MSPVLTDRAAAIRAALREVYDPELGASIVDLNMVRRVDVIDGPSAVLRQAQDASSERVLNAMKEPAPSADAGQALAQIDLVLTTPGCPLAFWLVEQVRRAARTVPGIADASVRVLDEPWQPPGRATDWQDWIARVLGKDG
jgi:metal-sulfur cluster biosynthetic enzyme